MSLGEYVYAVGDTILARGPAGGLGPFSRVLCCPTCGAAGWGRITFEGETSPGHSRWRALDAICPGCPSGASSWYAAGSFIPAIRAYTSGLGEEFDWADCFPPEVIAWEAEQYLNYWRTHYEQHQRDD